MERYLDIHVHPGTWADNFRDQVWVVGNHGHGDDDLVVTYLEVVSSAGSNAGSVLASMLADGARNTSPYAADVEYVITRYTYGRTFDRTPYTYIDKH